MFDVVDDLSHVSVESFLLDIRSILNFDPIIKKHLLLVLFYFFSLNRYTCIVDLPLAHELLCCFAVWIRFNAGLLVQRWVEIFVHIYCT